MTNLLTSQAVMAAINSSWKEAIKINAKILSEDPQDIEALNRLAYAYLETGDCNRAQKHYKKVLIFEPYNPIAQRNLKRMIESGSMFPRKGSKKSASVASFFLEETGKTKVVIAIKLAGKTVLNRLRTGDLLTLVPKKHFIAIHDERDIYIGSLPEDISFRLIEFIKKGNKYDCYVRSVDKNYLCVFLKEISRSNKLKNVISFCPKFEVKDLKNKERPEKEEAEEEITENFEEKEMGVSI